MGGRKFVSVLLALACASSASSQTTDWGRIEHKGEPWVSNVSRPIEPTRGMHNTHLSLWASHGRYYNAKTGTWRWQRPKMFGTCEDLLTSSFVLPYLIPMLENAGAIVFYPRERDTQANEIIIDNDNQTAGNLYLEVGVKHDWEKAPGKGFAMHRGNYHDNENPFEAGTARVAKTVKPKKKNYSIISYQPTFPEDGSYAVYVSYESLPRSVDDATYTVWHKGGETTFKVNQRMGGGTWVYLGTFDFDKGSSEYNRVTLTNRSKRKGYVTADAVRFGGGMGNIERGGTTSGMARWMEGSRYYAQWAGMPYSVYSTRKGTDDYADDINTRSLMTNYVGGGSCYMPNAEGLNVPIELSLAVHSDAGFSKDPDDIIGSLSICTTNHNNGLLDAGMSRDASKELATMLIDNLDEDIKAKYGKWTKRKIYDRNYSETRLPNVPSAIIETLAHQNFGDMRMAHDPNFKFTLARSIYKTLLRYTAKAHGRSYVVTPLSPTNFAANINDRGQVELSWTKVADSSEPTSVPDGYIVYTSKNGAAFDNGVVVKKSTSAVLDVEPGVLYSFRVSAYNRGGESFPTETLCALYNPIATKTILVVDGFDRFSTPAQVNTETMQGFDFDADAGVGFGSMPTWVGRQINFDRSKAGTEGEDGLGYSNDDFTGISIAGNNRDNVFDHARAIMSAGKYSIASCSAKALENGAIYYNRYSMIDFVLGLQRNDSCSLIVYKTFNAKLRNKLSQYSANGGALLVSGAYVGSDMTSVDERQFMGNVMKVNFKNAYRGTADNINGFGTSFDFYHEVGETRHYSAPSVDVIDAVQPAFVAMRYADGGEACVAYKGGDYRSLTFGFPLECIKDKSKLGTIMRASLRFLLE